MSDVMSCTTGCKPGRVKKLQHSIVFEFQALEHFKVIFSVIGGFWFH